MDKQQQIREIILQLKKIKADSHWTNQEIYDMVEKSGLSTSPSTIRRLFDEDSENRNFNYRLTIQPIAKVMFAMAESEKIADVNDNVLQAQLDGLKQVCELNEKIIKDLQNELEGEKRKVAHLLKQVDQQSRMLDKLLG